MLRIFVFMKLIFNILSYVYMTLTASKPKPCSASISFNYYYELMNNEQHITIDTTMESKVLEVSGLGQRHHFRMLPIMNTNTCQCANITTQI